jgi:hypothetical protein
MGSAAGIGVSLPSSLVQYRDSNIVNKILFVLWLYRSIYAPRSRVNIVQCLPTSKYDPQNHTAGKPA